MRPAAVAGTWYPATAAALADAVDTYLGSTTREVTGDLVALVAPHAGLVYSGPVAAHAYRLLAGRTFDVAVIVGPSHFVSFDGVAVSAAGGFDTPLRRRTGRHGHHGRAPRRFAHRPRARAGARARTLDRDAAAVSASRRAADRHRAAGDGTADRRHGTERWRTRWAASLAAVVRCSWRAPICRTITTPPSRPASTPW